MRTLRMLVIYIAAVFLGGALLAPWLYFVAQHFAPTLPKIAGSPFHRFVNRSMLTLAIAGLWPLLKQLGITSMSATGLIRPYGQKFNLLQGLALGFISLALLAGLTLAAGAREFNPTLSGSQAAGKLGGAALTSIIVSVLEELLFRGALFGSLRKAFHWTFALALSSMIYALVHFLERAELQDPVTWSSGLRLLPLMLGGFGNLHALVPGFFNLTLAGMILALAYEQTGTLYYSIGLHAGWIFWLKSYGTVTREMAASSPVWWGSGKMVDGWLALPVLAATLLALLKFRPGRVILNSCPPPAKS